MVVFHYGAQAASLLQEAYDVTQYPVDTVKIDRSIVANLGQEGNRGEAVVSAVIALAHSLGDTLVAEGVENEDQVGRLRNLGCELVQGFHLGMPCPAKEAFALYRESLKETGSG